MMDHKQCAMTREADARLRAFVRDLRAERIGVHRVVRSTGRIDLGDLDMEDEAWSGVRIELTDDGLCRVVGDLERPREEDDTVEGIYDTVRCELGAWCDDDTEITWPTLAPGRRDWMVSVTRLCSRRVEALDFAKWILTWML